MVELEHNATEKNTPQKASQCSKIHISCVCVCVSGVWRENKKNTSAHTVKKRLNRCGVVIQSALKSVGFGYHLPPGRRKAVWQRNQRALLHKHRSLVVSPLLFLCSLQTPLTITWNMIHLHSVFSRKFVLFLHSINTVGIMILEASLTTDLIDSPLSAVPFIA